MIWMGIALRCLLLLFNFVMFRYVLGYEIREKACWPLVALTAAAADVSELVFGYCSSSNLIMGQSFFAFRPFKNRSGSHICFMQGIRIQFFHGYPNGRFAI